MPSATEIKRVGRPYLDEMMFSAGFQLGRGYSYYRRTSDDLYQAVLFWPSIYGQRCTVMVTCTVPERHPDFGESKFPPKSISILYGGDLQQLAALAKVHVGRAISADLNTEKGQAEFFTMLQRLIPKVVFPYFDENSSRQKLWDSLPEEHRNQPYMQIQKEFLLGKQRGEMG